MGTEYILRKPLESTHQTKFPPTDVYDAHHSVVVDVTTAEKNVFKEMYVDPEAMALLPDKLEDQLTKERLLELVKLSVSSELKSDPDLHLTDKITRILTAGTHGRAVPTTFVDFLVDDRLSSTGIFGKGGLVSGARYPIPENRDEILTYFERYFETPQGLLGKKDAKREIETSKKLIQHGGYAALSFAYFEFDVEALHAFIETYWASVDTETAKELHKAVNQVIKNGDRPAYLFRTGATARRHDYKHLKHYIDSDSDRDVVTKRLVTTEMRQAARI